MLQPYLKWIFVPLTAALAAHAAAQGVSDSEVVFGQTAGITGPVAGSVKESNEGVALYFDWINAQGGVHGRKLVLDSRDDKFSPKLAAENAQKMLAERPPIAFLLPRGTPMTEAIVPFAQAAKIPVIAPGTGAEIFHTPVNPLVFNLRAKYQTEVEKAIEHLHTLGTSRIALVYVNDSFGADGLAGFQRKMAALKLAPAASLTFDRASGDMGAVVPALLKADPQAVILVASAVHSSRLIEQMRKQGNQAQFVTLSNNATKSFIAGLGPNARGVVVAQAFPNPRGNAAIVREMKALAKNRPDLVISQQTIEGFAAAKLAVEALRRAGRKPTPALLVGALESIREFDMGGFMITYGPTDRTGAEFVEMSIIDSRGEFMQ